MRINTRLSPRVQLQFRVPERRSLGTRLVTTFWLNDVTSCWSSAGVACAWTARLQYARVSENQGVFTV